MKIAIAPDKFKGSLTGLEFCSIVQEELKRYDKEIELIKLPLADGGDGTIDTVQFYIDGEIISAKVNDPLMRVIEATYLYSTLNKIAFIEMAKASGVALLNSNEQNPLETTTFGVGELIVDAIKRGAKTIILGVGGSATNDAGIGMAKALGFKFLDSNGVELEGKGRDLNNLHSIVSPSLKKVKFKIACDVNNPLFGPDGAAQVYAPQKGASPEIVKELDRGLENFHNVVKNQFGIDLQNVSGTGAAGGLGAGGILFLDATLRSGIELIKDLANFDNRIKDVDWIITGEGKLDNQTLSGKVIKGVLDSKTDQKLALFCGINRLRPDQVADCKIDSIIELSTYAESIEDSIANSEIYLRKAISEFARRYL